MVLDREPNIKKLDFSQFHPLDHMPFTSECRGYYGGGKGHFLLLWEYRWRRRIITHTLCQINHHEWCDGWIKDKMGDRHPVRVCWNCGTQQ